MRAYNKVDVDQGLEKSSTRNLMQWLYSNNVGMESTRQKPGRTKFDREAEPRVTPQANFHLQ